MNSNSTNSTSNMPSANVSGTGSTLELSLTGILSDEAIKTICSSSTLDHGEPWSFAALLAPWNEFDLQNCASSAPNPQIPTTQNNACGQAYPLHSPRPMTSPTTSTESLSPFGLARSFDDMFPSISPAEYSAFVFPSPATPATMGQDIAFPFLAGSPSPADVLAHAAQLTTASKHPGTYNSTASPVWHPAVPSAKASLVQGGPLQQESLFTCPSASVGQPWVSFAFYDLDRVTNGIASRLHLLHFQVLSVLFIPTFLRILSLLLHP